MEKENSFRPFIPADKIIPEITPLSLVLGALLAVVFGAANAYLGLRVGLTVSASIPAAVISMGIVRGVLKRDSILENNMVQTIGSAGESLAAGAIFTLPAFFLWFGEWGTGNPSYWMITFLALGSGLLGVLLMVPLRRALIVNEHETLPYPEGSACAEVLRAGESGGDKAKTTFLGAGVGAAYKLLAEGFRLFPAGLELTFQRFKGTALGLDALPALMGVGYITGPRIASYMFSGGCVGWFCILPLIYYFGSFSPEVIYPATDLISNMNHSALWSNYLRYIGAGAVAFGGLYSLAVSLPDIIKSFRASAKILGSAKDGTIRTDRDLPLKWVLIAAAVILAALALIPAVPVNFAGALLIFIFGFFFSTVSSRIVGFVGSSNSPVSGMTIATLLITTLLYVTVGKTGREAMIAVMCIASAVAIIAAISGDTSQDLKTGYLLGATPRSQQLGELLGVTVTALVIGWVLILLNSAWGFGSAELPAVQATLMKMIVEGVMLGEIPWVLVLTGAGIGVMLAVLRLPVLPVCIGLYLPLSLSSAIMVGGLLRLLTERLVKRSGADERLAKDKLDGGILYASGLIAGEGLMGILLAVFAVAGVSLAPAGGSILGQPFGLLAFVLLGLSLLKSSAWRRSERG